MGILETIGNWILTWATVLIWIIILIIIIGFVIYGIVKLKNRSGKSE
jgi:flagellar biogenesis protein FliO